MVKVLLMVVFGTLDAAVQRKGHYGHDDEQPGFVYTQLTVLCL